ncbi:MmgE/PrpD family protein [Orrella sp. 11846]|uniref:MmgE/PrpD family protein n=1 Tax=Orrella sp. 11846 TaxID=3409913 RepID=UPI003B58F22A
MGQLDTQSEVTQPLKISLTQDLARWASELQFKDLPDDVIHQVKRLVLDYYCAVIAGSTTSTSRVVREYFCESEASGIASIVGTPFGISAANAAFVNGTAAHGMELDDGYTPGSYHPGAACIPAIMAVAETYQSDYQDVVLAIVVSYEISCRLARAGHPHTWKNGFHNTGINGVLGAAAGVGKLLQLDTKKMTWALGMAGSFSSGLFEFLGEGAEIKRIHPGKTARDGVIVAELAKRGIDGPRTGLEGRNGYFKAYANAKADMASVMDGLGSTWELLQTYVKPYPCCRHLHAPIDGILALKTQDTIDLANITRILIETHQVAARHAHTTHETILDAQMSIPFAVATALLHDQVGLEAFSHAARHHPNMADLISKVEVEITDDMQRAYPKQRPANIIIEFKDGSRLTKLVPQPYGEPDHPLDDSALTSKFHAICDTLIGQERVNNIAKACWDLDFPEIFKLTKLKPEEVKEAQL